MRRDRNSRLLDARIDQCDARPGPGSTGAFRAGAALPAETNDAYIRKVIAAGGIRQYERNHLNALTATFAPHFAHLPPELVRRVVEYAFHVGDY